MTKYREILRLHSLGLSQKDIAGSCNVSKKTVNKVLKAAEEKNIFWPLSDTDTDALLQEKLFPKTTKCASSRTQTSFCCCTP
jgi:transcriptional regulator with XRE-family HTH domain